MKSETNVWIWIGTFVLTPLIHSLTWVYFPVWLLLGINSSWHNYFYVGLISSQGVLALLVIHILCPVPDRLVTWVTTLVSPPPHPSGFDSSKQHDGCSSPFIENTKGLVEPDQLISDSDSDDSPSSVVLHA